MYKMDRKNLNHLMSDVYNDIDVPQKMLATAERNYKHLSDWLKEDSLPNLKSDSLLYIQGSTLLGTSIKPLKSDDDYDLDLVYRRNLSKNSLSQSDLKKQVGEQIRRYIKSLEESNSHNIPRLEEGKRCWTLQYTGNFHMDILPALPDPEQNYKMNPMDGILITDKELSQWQSSNPKGYYAWFKELMTSNFYKSRALLAKSRNVEVESIPEHEVKTTLQRAIQILKRHRDCNYQGSPENKPISIIITTLASHAYNNNENLYETLHEISGTMSHYIKNRDGNFWVENPINQKENFADKWNTHPEREPSFRIWLEKVKEDLQLFENETNIELMTTRLNKSFGISDAATMMNAADTRAKLTMETQNIQTKSSPWSY